MSLENMREPLETCAGHLEIVGNSSLLAGEDMQAALGHLGIAQTALSVAFAEVDKAAARMTLATAALQTTETHANASAASVQNGETSGSAEPAISSLPEYTQNLATFMSTLLPAVRGHEAQAGALARTLKTGLTTIGRETTGVEENANQLRSRKDDVELRGRIIRRYLERM